jgi:Family of unknown function (DUF5636)
MLMCRFTLLTIGFALLAATSSCKHRQTKSQAKSQDTGGSCSYNATNAQSSALLSATNKAFDGYLNQSQSKDSTEQQIRDAVKSLAKNDPEQSRQLLMTALSIAQARMSEKVLPIILKNVAGYGVSTTDLIFLSGLDLSNPQRYVDIISDDYKKYYACTAKAGLTIKADGRWDFSQAKLTVQSIAKDSCLKTALSLFFAGAIGTEKSMNSGEAIFIGENAISVCPDYAVRSKTEWNKAVQSDLDGFKAELANFLAASGSGSSYSEWMKGRYGDYAGTRPHEIEKDGSYQALSKYRNMMKCLGVNKKLDESLSIVMQQALAIDAKNIQAGISKLNQAEMAAAAAPLIPITIYLAPIVGGSMVGPVLASSIGTASATMALLPIAFSGALAAINTSIDTIGNGGNWLCKFGEELANAGSGSLVMAPFMAAIPVAPALLSGGATYVTASAAIGTQVYGASNIVVAIGFIGSMGYNGVSEIQQCRSILAQAQKLSLTANDQNAINTVNTMLTEAVKLCASGGIDIAFAVSGGTSLVNAATRTKAALASAEVAKVQSEKLAEFNNEFMKELGGRDEFGKLPTGIPNDYAQGLETMRAMMRDKALVFKLVQQLEVEVAARAEKKGIKNFDAMMEILAETEKKNGFKPALDLPSKSFTAGEWMDMLSEGALFRDVVFTNAERANGSVSHGRDTHRIQWNAVMRYMAQEPKKFGVKTAVELFKMLGNKEVNGGLNWDGTNRSGGQSTWSPFFDSFESNFSSPEWFRSRHELWPGLGDWALQQPGQNQRLQLLCA